MHSKATVSSTVKISLFLFSKGCLFSSGAFALPRVWADHDRSVFIVAFYRPLVNLGTPQKACNFVRVMCPGRDK